MTNRRTFSIKSATLKWWCLAMLCVAVSAVLYVTLQVKDENSRVLVCIGIGIILVALVFAFRFSGVEVVPIAYPRPAKRWPFVLCASIGIYAWGVLAAQTTGTARYLSLLILAATAVNWFFLGRHGRISAKASRTPPSM